MAIELAYNDERNTVDRLDTDIRFSIIPEWILVSDISDRAVRVYGVLARFADNTTLRAFPRRSLMARMANCSLSSLDRALDELIEAGAIVKEARLDAKGQHSNLYFVRRAPSSGVTTPLVRGDYPPSSPVTTITRTIELDTLNYIFDQFWEIYPRKVGKQAAYRALEKALAKYDGNVILDGLKRMVADKNLPAKKFLPHPSTWLNEGRWEDEPYPDLDQVVTRPRAETPGRNEWKLWYHEQDDHTFCNPGDFDH